MIFKSRSSQTVGRVFAVFLLCSISIPASTFTVVTPLRAGSSPWLRRVGSLRALDEGLVPEAKVAEVKSLYTLPATLKPVPSLSTIRKALSPEVFEIDTFTSLTYFFKDLGLIFLSSYPLYYMTQSLPFQGLPFTAQLLLPVPLQLASGFALWNMWCIGHDAGHGLVSKSGLVNEVVGEVAHSMFSLTPFSPWRLSHKKHHLNHNHLTDDYSHQWFVREEDPLSGVWWMDLSHKTRMLQLPILYLVYLLAGVPDGGHVVPYGRMWEGEPASAVRRGLLSSLVSVSFAAALLAAMGPTTFATVCLVPWSVMSMWLFTVTYMQHHSPDGKLYTDDTWSFVLGGFETVDRDYGWVNDWSHNMMDGHVMHHLFFTKVPHYRLKQGTDEMVAWLKERDQMELYKRVDTKDFVGAMWETWRENWFFVDEKNVVR